MLVIAIAGSLRPPGPCAPPCIRHPRMGAIVLHTIMSAGLTGWATPAGSAVGVGDRSPPDSEAIGRSNWSRSHVPYDGLAAFVDMHGLNPNELGAAVP